MTKYIEREELVERINKRIELTNPVEQEWVKDECIRQAYCMSAISPKQFYKAGVKDLAKRLKENFPQGDRNNKCPALYWDDYCYIIDSLVEELVGANNG